MSNSPPYIAKSASRLKAPISSGPSSHATDGLKCRRVGLARTSPETNSRLICFLPLPSSGIESFCSVFILATGARNGSHGRSASGGKSRPREESESRTMSLRPRRCGQRRRGSPVLAVAEVDLHGQGRRRDRDRRAAGPSLVEVAPPRRRGGRIPALVAGQVLQRLAEIAGAGGAAPWILGQAEQEQPLEILRHRGAGP